MDQKAKASELRWQQLQSHIEGFLEQALKNDIRSIEYKPRFIVPLLAAPSEHRNRDERREVAK